MVQAFATGEVSDVESFVHVDYMDHQGLRGAQISGPEGFRRVVSAARSVYSSLDVWVEDLIVEGSKVAARLRWSGQRASDSAIVIRETIDIVRFEGGQAKEHWGTQLWIETE